ncbi:uncharacterized protein LOC141910558 [Tubulanus polymorphus]|uniref:uncharacterized protein LOC141910558 n=1 Tax=Tubulanus polymorphus TaxID=672921 RepID=UPI003DA422AB
MMEVADEITLLKFCTAVADELVTGLVFADRVDLGKLTQYKKGALKLKADHPWATRLIHCLDIHFRAATKWRTFQEELREIELRVEESTKKLKETLELYKDDLSSKGVDSITREISNASEVRNDILPKLSKLYAQAATLPCLEKRNEPLKKPFRVHMICSLRTKHVKLKEGEAMTLLDNHDPVQWKVQQIPEKKSKYPTVIDI